jgi:phytanoyl-CoA hydroxylase
MDYGTYKEAYDRDGFVIVRDFLTPAELAELVAEIGRFVREVAPALPATQAFYQAGTDGKPEVRQIHRVNCDPYFDAYLTHPKWTGLARALVGEAVTPRLPVYFNKPPGSDFPTPPHQDNCAFGLDPANAVQIFLAVAERLDEENGCLRYITGSHRQGPREHRYSGVRGFALEISDFGPADEAREVLVELNPGDVVCHHPLTVHRALRNRSASRSRVAFAIWFRGESARVNPELVAFYEVNARTAQTVGR